MDLDAERARLALFLGGLGAIAESLGSRRTFAAGLAHGFTGTLADPFSLSVNIYIETIFSSHQYPFFLPVPLPLPFLCAMACLATEQA